jgi:hypothetical protein
MRRVVKVEIDLVESEGVPYEDVNLPFQRRTIESHCRRPLGVQAHGEPCPGRRGSRLNAQAAQGEDDADTECDHEFAAAQRRPRPT